MAYCERDEREKHLFLIRLNHILFAKHNQRYQRFKHWSDLRARITARNRKAAGHEQ